MTLFERSCIDDKELHQEQYNAYYSQSDSEDVCHRILQMFGINAESGHIVNGHVI